MEDHNAFGENENTHNFGSGNRSNSLDYQDPLILKELDHDLKPASIPLMSDIFDCIVGKYSEVDSTDKFDSCQSSNNLKLHIRQLAVQERREYAQNILKTDTGMQVVDAIKARIAYYMVSE